MLGSHFLVPSFLILVSLLQKELDGILKDYVGRESPLYFAERLTDHYRRPNGEGPHIYLKREDLNHTGAHKINNAVAQALLAKKLGKKRIIAETGAGQHGVATATVCARFGLECIVYMGAQDMERQALNVFRMRLLGAEVCIYYMRHYTQWDIRFGAEDLSCIIILVYIKHNMTLSTIMQLHACYLGIMSQIQQPQAALFQH